MAQLKWSTLADFQKVATDPDCTTRVTDSGRTQVVEYLYAGSVIAKCVKFYKGQKVVKTAWFVDPGML